MGQGHRRAPVHGAHDGRLMLTRIVAQGLVDALCAVTLGASLFAITRRSTSQLGSRLVFAFAGMFALFAARAATSLYDLPQINLYYLFVVCLLPLAALLLAEGVLRRHAPALLKVSVTAGAVAMAAALVAEAGGAPAATWWLGIFFVSALTGVAVLLLARDRNSLSRQENAGVTALVASGVFLICLSITDFVPQAPIGLSGIGAAIVALALGTNPSSPAEVRGMVLNVLLLVIIAAACAVTFAHPFGLHTVDEQWRLGAILLSLLLAANAVSNLRDRGASPEAQRLAQALANADTSSLDKFLNSLADQPLLAGLRIAEGPLLEEYNAPALASAMDAQAVWTRAKVSERVGDRPREELIDLMTRTEATHALLISQAPLRIALLTLPGAGSNDGSDVSLALFRKLSGVAASNDPR
jgi:hypothetical protein